MSKTEYSDSDSDSDKIDVEPLPTALERYRSDDLFVPKRLDRAIKVYEQMEKHSQPAPSHYGAGYQVFEGSLQPVMIALKIPVSFYSDIVSVLKDMNCVTMIQRGNRDVTSRWLLHRAPTLELYKEKKETEPHNTSAAAQVRELRRVVGDISRRMATMEIAINEQAELIYSLQNPQTPEEKRMVERMHTNNRLLRITQQDIDS